MATTVAMSTPTNRKLGNLNSNPGLLRRSYDPAGNYLASKLRQIFDDSSVFPESNYSTEIRKQRRWQSLVQSDYQPVLNWREVYIRAKKPKTSLPFKDVSTEPDKMFMQWKVPSRLTENYEDVKASRGSMRDGCSPVRQENIPTPGGSIYNFKPPSAMSNKFNGNTRPPSHLTPPSAGRNAVWEAHADILPIQASATPNGMMSPTRSLLQSPVKTATVRRPRMTKAQREKELLLNFENHEVPTTENHWFKGAAEDPGRLSLPPTNGQPKKPTSSVRRWIGNASDNDRQVALDFISSMSSNHNSGTLRDIVDLLQSPKDGSAPVQTQSAKQTRYLRLLTPQTRDKPWMQQTWHHLPTYKQPDATNKGAIYVVSNGTVPRHFTIHPEWGP